MCGICGFAGINDKKLLIKMMNSISHRGPDAQGHFFDSNISLGHRRLAVIDLSSNGKQPMSDSKGKVWITYNGELYNYLDIKKKLPFDFKSMTDTEVIIYSYIQYGEDCLGLFEGDFAFCIYDSEHKKLFLARDRFGVKPLYYYFDGNVFLFASEIKALLHYVKPAVNLDKIPEYLAYRFVSGQDTLFKNIKRVLPGQKLVYHLQSKKLEVSSYWDVPYDSQPLSRNLKYFKENVDQLLTSSVNSRLVGDVPIGVFLSGGIDSSTIVAKMKNNTEIKTFSVGFGYDSSIDEIDYSRKIAEYFSTTHKEFVVKSNIVENLPKIIYHSDEPIADPALLPVYLLSREAKRYVTVVLTGDGGDEVFAGYEQYKMIPYFRKLANLPEFIRKDVFNTFLNITPDKLLNKFFKYSSSLGDEGKKRAVDVINSESDYLTYENMVSVYNSKERLQVLINDLNLNNSFVPSSPLLNKILYFEYKSVLPENYLMKTDKMSMAHGLEARVPFLHKDLVEFAFKIPNSLKINRLNEKYILKKTMSQYLPNYIVQRKKQRFYVPIDLWIKDDLNDYVTSLLSKSTIQEQGIFNYEPIQKMISNFDNSKLFYARQIWSLINFQIWYKKYILNEKI